MRLLLGIVTVIVVLLSILSDVARQIGLMQSVPDDLRLLFDTRECQPSCWHGITPGITSFHNAVQHLRSDTVKAVLPDPLNESSYQVCWKFTELPEWSGCVRRNKGYDPLDELVLYPTHPDKDNTIQLDAVLSILGEPIYVVTVKAQKALIAYLFFPNNVRVAVRGSFVGCYAFRLSPDMQVFQINYNVPGSSAYDTQNWHGLRRITPIGC